MNTSTKLLGLSAIAATMMSTSALAQVNASLQIENAANLTGSTDVVARISFTNTEDQPVSMLSYLMKANKNGDLEENLFTITRDGKPVPYEGRHVKRPAPAKSDYITIKPGQTVSYKVELSGVYDLKESGNYAIQYNAKNMSLFSAQPMLNAKAANMGMDGVYSNEASVFINKGKYDYVTMSEAKRCNPKKQDCGGGTGGGTGGISFSGACSSSEQTDLLAAVDAARNMASDAVSSLAGPTGNRYTTWFGTYTASRHNTMVSHFDAIKDAVDNQPLTLDCSCNQSYYAYVYPNQPYKIYFCRAFWNAPLTGTDSRGGTIIHETSHFNVVAGTDDIVYGQSGAKSLAISNPDDAIRNADSHEYFAENTPHQN